MFRKNLCYFITTVLILGGVGCGKDNGSASSSPSTSNPASNEANNTPLPKELHFTKIEQQFQQQQQQVGRLCPKNFNLVVQDSGQVTVNDPQGNELMKGKMPDQDLARLAIAANDVVLGGTDERQVDCDTDNPWQQFNGTRQVFVTNKQDQTDLVSTGQSDRFCDFTKGKRGKDFERQMNKVAQQSCGGGDDQYQFDRAPN